MAGSGAEIHHVPFLVTTGSAIGTAATALAAAPAFSGLPTFHAVLSPEQFEGL